MTTYIDFGDVSRRTLWSEGSFSCFLSVTKSQIRVTHYNFRNDFIIWIRQTCKCLKPN